MSLIADVEICIENLNKELNSENQHMKINHEIWHKKTQKLPMIQFKHVNDSKFYWRTFLIILKQQKLEQILENNIKNAQKNIAGWIVVSSFNFYTNKIKKLFDHYTQAKHISQTN